MQYSQSSYAPKCDKLSTDYSNVLVCLVRELYLINYSEKIFFLLHPLNAFKSEESGPIS